MSTSPATPTPRQPNHPADLRVGNAVGGAFCILLGGIGVGWLIGLSASPVVQAVITAIITFLVTAAGIVSNIETRKDVAQDNPRVPVRPLAVAALMVGLGQGHCR
jgi:hypothetical protein